MARVIEVFRVFLWLGLTSFGGPVAHLGYFRSELVEKRGWLSDAAYADLVALCQFLPGPASSQVGFGLGLMRAGWGGALAAWLAFTLPSALALVVLATMATTVTALAPLLQGLKIVAVAIVAHAVLGMARTLCPDRARASMALLAAALVLLLGGLSGQLWAIAVGMLGGMICCRHLAGAVPEVPLFGVSRRAGLVALGLFVVLLGGLPWLALATAEPGWQLFDSFYRAGALVFGGGHVVLPLLEAETVQAGRVGAEAFLAGYGATQAVPGPLFTFSGFLGAEWAQGLGASGLMTWSLAGLALVAVFLPGFLLLVAVLPFWQLAGQWAGLRALMAGANAAVVGILAAALYQPVFTSAIHSSAEMALALLCFVLLTSWKAPSWLVVIVGALGGWVLGF
ncbi:chromate efflux transporter [Oceanobacter sp. 3_MG-2023]|uniref:chromate efflux transporter n=1 Tax=Oceanobacter sp. 3_MG-2023 TaxID=3062622 RepID=UPI0027341741|nr:chromate efflux transporter [Oceanobacter sp. 3_MG-2023]MDP2504545.1 chromate efflux transporter [Oceanobacter sp. 3_MG-2023]